MKRWISLIPLVLLLLVSCSKEQPASTPVAFDDNTPRDGGTLTRRLDSDIATLNPITATNRSDRLVANYLFAPLVYIDANLQAIPAIAEKWEISPDGKTYTFHLNAKATFSDGTPVRASDVLFTLNKAIDPQSEAPQVAGDFDKMDPALTHVVDDHTIQVVFREVLASQLVKFNNLLILPEHVYAKGDFKAGFASNAVGSGPYRLVRRVPGREVVLLRREDYWGKKPYIPNVVFKVVIDDATAWNAVQRGDIDETQITSDIWAMASQRKDLQRRLDIRRFYTLNYNFVAWNNRDPILSDSRVRRALAKCIDLKSLINNLYHGTARAMTGPFTPDQFAYNPSVPAIGYDPEGARADLNGLGWLDTDGDGILNDRHKKPLKFDMLVFGGSAAVPFAQLYQAELKRIGVQLNIVQLDPSTVFQRLLAGNYQSCYLSLELDPDPDNFNLFHSTAFPPHGQNFTYYSNPEVDRLIDTGRTTLDRVKRVKVYQQIHELLAHDQPCTWTMQVSVKWAITRRVRNVKESKGFGLFLWYPGELDWWLARGGTREGDQKRR